jgi:UDP-glucose 4-epimerase
MVAAMGEGQTIHMTGGRGRVARALAACARFRGRLVLISRRGGEGLLALDDWLAGRGEIESAGVVLHAAWSSVPATAEEAPPGAEAADLELAGRLVERLRPLARPPLLMFMSTGAVYGAAAGQPRREDDPPRPGGRYAAAKRAAEELFLLSGLPVCILRPGNLFGLASSAGDRQGVIARLARCALAGRPFERWGANPVKDYLHLEDFAAALDRLATIQATGIWNIGSGRPAGLDELVAAVEAAAGRRLEVVSRPAPAWDASDNRLDIGKLLATGWRPQVPLAQGIAREVAAVARECPPPE